MTFVFIAAILGGDELPRFRPEMLDEKAGEIWAISVADVNADGKPDVLALSYNPDQVFWYENPSPSTAPGARWKRRVVVQKHPKMPVAVQPLDVDGDGKVELILGAEYYEPLDTTRGGSVWLLKRPRDLDQPWTPVALNEEPTLHRIHLLDGKDLVCSALLGRDKKPGAAIFLLRRERDEWRREEVSRELNVVHNTFSVDWDGDGKEEVLAAAREGLVLFKRTEGGWERRQVGAGSAGKKRGSSEVAAGRLPGGKRYLAAAEPHHGHEAAIYTEPEKPGVAWNRKVIHVNRGGHTVWPADLTGSGVDTLLFGFVGAYSDHPGGPIWYLFHPRDERGETWEKVVLDDTGIPGEDGACCDFNGDGKLDVVIGGGSRVKVYWNLGK